MAAAGTHGATVSVALQAPVSAACTPHEPRYAAHAPSYRCRGVCAGRIERSTGIRGRLVSPWVVVAALALAGEGLRDSVLGVAWPMIRADFGAPLDALGILLTTFTCGYVAMSGATGALFTRVAARHLIPVTCGLVAAALLAGSFANTWLTLVACFALAGLGSGGFDAAINAHASLTSGPRIMNLLHASYGAGAVCGPVALGTLLKTGGRGVMRTSRWQCRCFC